MALFNMPSLLVPVKDIFERFLAKGYGVRRENSKKFNKTYLFKKDNFS